MRAIISVVLIALLLATSVTPVLGQARQRDSIAPQSSAVRPPQTSDSSSVLEPVSWESWVPTLESSSGTDLLLAPRAVGRWGATDSLPVAAAAAVSTETAITVVVAVAMFAAVGYLLYLIVKNYESPAISPPFGQ